MTQQKRLKDRIRARMAKTGERYTTARRHILSEASPGARSNGPTPYPPGSIPAVAALRTLLRHRGIVDARTGAPPSEAMVFGVGGGIGMGVFSFRYEEDDASSFFLAGRHLWEDDRAFLEGAAARLGVPVRVVEAGGARAARDQLDGLLTEGAPVVAWVDMAMLPYRGMPASREGSGYHVVTVLEADEGEVVVGDVADEPVRVPRETFEAARARIRKFKHRLLALDGSPAEGAGGTVDFTGAARAGIREGLGTLLEGRTNFSLEALAQWADRLEGKGGKNAWSRVFPPGRHFWTALTWTYDCIEHYGTGGGLCRPMFADVLAELADAEGGEGFTDAADRYGAIGEDWSGLAAAALPDGVPLFAKARALLADKAETFLSDGAAAADRYPALWADLSALGREASESFPLSDTECADLRAELAGRVRALHAAEVEAARGLAAAVG